MTAPLKLPSSKRKSALQSQQVKLMPDTSDSPPCTCVAVPLLGLPFLRSMWPLPCPCLQILWYAYYAWSTVCGRTVLFRVATPQHLHKWHTPPSKRYRPPSKWHGLRYVRDIPFILPILHRAILVLLMYMCIVYLNQWLHACCYIHINSNSPFIIKSFTCQWHTPPFKHHFRMTAT